MQKIFFLFTLFLIQFSFSQSFYSFESLDDLENLKNYKKVIVKYPIFKIYKSTYSFHLKDGKIIEHWYKSKKLKSGFKSKYHYNQFNHIDYKVIYYDLAKGNVNDTIFYNLMYNSSNQLIKSNYTRKECYSNFNENGLPQKIDLCERSISKDSIIEINYKTELIYNSQNKIIKKTTYSIVEKKIEINEIIYKYDSKGNIIELSRKNTPKTEFPIYIIGGLAQYENERFRYKFNKDGIWTKKYWIIEGKEYLIEKRKLVK
jgi:hypothetical protein